MARQLKVEYRAIGKLKPYANNARQHPPEQIDKIRKALQRFGWTNPILVDGKNGIVAGHGRLQAALQLAMRTVPVIELAGLTAADKRAYMIADNRIAEEAGWDPALLASEFSALKDMGADLLESGFDLGEIEDILRPSPGRAGPEEPPTVDPVARPVARLGDVWVAGNHRVICGDSTRAETYEDLMKGERAQCIFTDPPYGVSYRTRDAKFDDIANDDLRRGELGNMLHKAFAHAFINTQEDAGWYVWHADKTTVEFTRALIDVGVVPTASIIWAKPAFVLAWHDYKQSHEPCIYGSRQGTRPAWYGDRSESTIWRCAARTIDNEQHASIGNGIVLTSKGGEIFITRTKPKGSRIRNLDAEAGVLLSDGGGQDSTLWDVRRDHGRGIKDNPAIHPTQKPVELARRALTNSTAEGDIVLDMFGGSCGVLIAAEQLKRRAFLIELDPGYVDAGVLRWQTFTGRDAKLEKGGKTYAATKIERSKAPKVKPRKK